MIRETEPPKPSTRLQTLGDKLPQVALHRQTEAPKLLHQVRGDLDWIVMKCLEKDRQRRYETANGVAADVARHLTSEPILARAPSNLYRLQKLIRRNRFAFSALTAITAVLVLGVVVSAWQALRAMRAEREQNRLRLLAENALAQVQIQTASQFFEANDYPMALAYLARVLRQEPSNEAVAARVFSSLTQHNFIVPLTAPLQHSAEIYFAQFSPDGLQVVTASADGTGQIWDANTGQPKVPPLKHSGPVWFAQFAPDGLSVATASEDKTAQLWNARTGQPLAPPLQHAGSVAYLYYSPDGRRLLTSTWDSVVRIWNVENGWSLTAPIPNVRNLRCSPFSPDALFLVTPFENSATIRSALTGNPLEGTLAHPQYVISAEFSPNGKFIVTACADGIARVWDVRTRQLMTALNHGTPLWLARFSPDGRYVVTVCQDTTIQVWDAYTGRALSAPLRYQLSHRGAGQKRYPVLDSVYQKRRTAQFSLDSQMVVISAGGKAQLFYANTGEALSEPFRHDAVWAAEFSRDSQRIVTASLDGTARVWGIRRDYKETSAITLPIPEWMPRLLEALAEKRLNERGVVEPVPTTELQNLKRQLSASADSGTWTRWGKWLFTGVPAR
jgi:WD40 repeat protein